MISALVFGFMREGIEKLLSTGLLLSITELDIITNDFDKQANLYREVFKIIVDHYSDKLISVTIRGTTDENSWVHWGSPLLFRNYQPKPAYYAIMEL